MAIACIGPQAAGAGCGPVRVLNDPSGDAAIPWADIESVDMSTEIDRKSGRDQLVVRMNLADTPSDGPPIQYSVGFRFEGCEAMHVTFWWPGNVPQGGRGGDLNASSCHDADAVLITDPKIHDVRTEVKPGVIVWSAPLIEGLAAGVTLEAIRAGTSTGGHLDVQGGNFYFPGQRLDSTGFGQDYTICGSSGG